MCIAYFLSANGLFIKTDPTPTPQTANTPLPWQAVAMSPQGIVCARFLPHGQVIKTNDMCSTMGQYPAEAFIHEWAWQLVDRLTQ